MRINKSKNGKNTSSEIWSYVNDKIKDFYVEDEDSAKKLIINITPKDILKLSTTNTFGRMETEISSRWIIRFLADRDNTFLPFKLSELKSYCKKHLGKKEDFWFNGLDYGNPRRNLKPEVKNKKNIMYLSQRFIIFASINHKDLYLVDA